MRKPLFLAALAATVSVCCAQAPHARAQQRPVAPTIAILDMTYIYENHQGFQARRDSLKHDAERTEGELKQERDAIKQLAAGLQDFRSGTLEYKQLEEQIAKREAELKVRLQLQQKEFMQREAKIYWLVYQEILDEVRNYSERNGIALVLRFNGDPIDPDNPPEVVKQLNKPVVYYNRAIDITPVILERLHARQPSATRPPQSVPPQSVPRR